MKRAANRSLAPKEDTGRAIKFVTRGHGRALALIAVTAFIGGLIEAFFLVIVTRVAFAVTKGEGQINLVSNWRLSVDLTLWASVGLIMARIALAGYGSWKSADVGTQVVADIRELLSRAFLDSSWEVQQSQRSGSLQELLTTYSGQSRDLMSSLSAGVVAIANILALLGMAFAVDPAGALVLVLSVTLLGLLLRPLRSIVRRRARTATSDGMEFAVLVNEVSELGFELHVFHVQTKARARVNEVTERARKSAARLQFAGNVSTPVYIGLAYLAVIGALGVVAASHTASLTSLGATMLVMLRSLSYGQSAQGAYITVTGTVPVMEELQHRLEIFYAGQRVDEGKPIGQVGPLSMEGVWFTYPQGETVLRDISFTIAPCEVIGIVGPSGAGKSTLVQLLLGLRDPDQGRVLADNREISAFDRAEWARKVTFVPQASRLISGTIAENIRFFRDDVTQDDVQQASRLAHLHEDVEGFPERYEREVGKHGGHLSGGQQQRVCIARALVEKPDVLILDEPTSALDTRSEHLVRDTLQSLKERMTVIVIAHRLSTLSICDRIMVIKDGELKDFDTPSTLERSSEFYREALALSGLR